MSKVDLHIHSTASDGRFSPADIVRKSAERGLTFISLADHDTVDGIVPALAATQAFPQLKVIPCTEISTDIPKGEIHILGYFIDYTDHKLKAALGKMRHSRQERAYGMVTKLGKLGIHIEWQRVQEIAGSGSIGRPHVAQAMLEKGYITSLGEAFTKYIGRDGPAYVEREKMTPQQVVELILRANGLPVLAHPLTINDPETMVTKLKEAGLVGIEAYYNSYTTEEINMLVSLANKYNLITTGGSDYHGLDINTGAMIGDVDVPIASAKHLIALANQ
ncbi:PHP domain-containing protein [Chloroflexota bacterium]